MFTTIPINEGVKYGVSTQVLVRTQFEGSHFWGDAPDEVAFLRDLHRHMFHVEVLMTVEHSNRAIEIIMLKRHIDRICSSLTEIIKQNGLSCEDIAHHIAKTLISRYIPDTCIVQVLEDGENGGTVYYGKQ